VIRRLLTGRQWTPKPEQRSAVGDPDVIEMLLGGRTVAGPTLRQSTPLQ